MTGASPSRLGPFDGDRPRRRLRVWHWLVLGLAALVVAGVVYLKAAGHGPGEAAELLVQGSEKVLRDPIRPARASGARVLVFAFDGVGDDELRTAIRDGSAPHLAALLGRESPDSGVYAHAYAAPGVLSILPSTTYAAWTSLFTGEPASRTGVPGNEWFAREEGKAGVYYAPAPVSVRGVREALQVYTDQLMSAVTKVPTVYERAGVRAYVSLAALQRGADVVTIPEPSALGDIVGAFAKGLTGDEEEAKQDRYAAMDSNSVSSLLRTIEKRGLADLQVVYFPGIDLYTHVAPQPLPGQRGYLGEVLDPQVGRVLDAYRRRGALEGTYVLLVSDHGHTPVAPDDAHALGAGEPGEPTSLLERLGFRVRLPELDVSDDDHQAVVAYQGAFAYVYLADRSTCPRDGDRCDWKRPPRLEADVLAVARAFHEASRTGAGVPELRGTLDLVFARPPRPAGQPALPFQVWDGARLVPVGEYLRAHPRPDLLDLERRLHDLAAGPHGHRAGDVLLLARLRMEDPVEQRYYFSGRYRSWHGSPTEQDSRIPLVLARAGANGAALRDRLRRAVGDRPTQLSVTPLILELLKDR